MFQKNVDFVETRSFLQGYKDRGSAASEKTLIVIGVYRTTGLQKSLSSFLIKSYNTQIQKSIKKIKAIFIDFQWIFIVRAKEKLYIFEISIICYFFDEYSLKKL